MAEKILAVAGLHKSHFAFTSFCGVNWTLCGTRHMRSNKLVAVAMAFVPPSDFASAHSMFDCPLHSHTSPTRTLVNMIWLSPVTVSVIGPPAVSDLSRTSHLPATARVETFCP